MNLLIIAFVIGAFAATRAPAMPGVEWLAVVVPLAGALALFRATRWLAAAAAGAIYVFVFGGLALADRLPRDLAGKDLELVGRIVSLPARSGPLARFRFEIGECEDCWTRTTIMLSAYGNAFEPRVGERWRLTVRLSRPRGTVNPGLFDYDGWLLAEGLSARGYVRTEPAPQKLAGPGPRDWLQRFRARIEGQVREVIHDATIRGLLIALTIGDSAAIGSANWQVLSNTGTNHLLIISGLHVGLVAGGAFKLGRMLSLGGSAAGGLSLACALAYGFVAGMGLPVQRALIMTAVGLAGVILDRRVPPLSLFCLALGAVVLVNPFAMLASGFWLSFGAVFSLLYAFGAIVMSRRSVWSWLSELVRSQWVVFAGTMPLLLLLVYQVSLLAMAANLVAIPWVGLLVIPPLLLAMISMPLSETVSTICFLLAGEFIAIIWRYIDWLASMQWVFHAAAIDTLTLALAMAGTILMLSPGHPLPRWPALILWLPLFAPVDRPLGAGDMEVRVLDVGQGLAVVVRTRDHLLLYDAGPRYGERFDAGARIVVPAIRRLGARHIDSFIVSHLDTDHAGGAGAIRESFLVLRSLASERLGATVLACDVPRFWREGDTRVHVRPVALAGSDNDRSCVAWVTHGEATVLLPGDIERAGERRFTAVPLPDIDVLIVPHHGSDTSSTPAFINHVAPRLVVVSAGFDNRFGHPDDNVIERYRRRGIPVINTAAAGAVTIRLRSGRIMEIHRARSDHPRFWYD